MGKKLYETPTIEVVVFELKDSIAESGDHGSNAVCSEQIAGDEG